jgi:hypothetical protein
MLICSGNGRRMAYSSTVLFGWQLLLPAVLLMAQATQSLSHDPASTAHQRHLTAATELELQSSLTMDVPTSITSGIKARLSIPNYLGKHPGAPSPVRPRQLQHRASSCEKARPTFLLIPGEVPAVCGNVEVWHVSDILNESKSSTCSSCHHHVQQLSQQQTLCCA